MLKMREIDYQMQVLAGKRDLDINFSFETQPMNLQIYNENHIQKVGLWEIVYVLNSNNLNLII